MHTPRCSRAGRSPATLASLSVFVVLSLASCTLSHGRATHDDAGAIGPDAGPLTRADAGADSGAPADAGLEEDLGRCDDLDPCTLDVIVDGACVSSAAPDGTRCDDGDSCTLGDRCASGRCLGGTTSTGSAEIVSVSVPALRGAAVGVGADRFVFFQRAASGTDVVLARGDGDRLDTLHELHLTTSGITGGFWLGDELVAYAAGQRGGLLAIAGDRLVARGEIDLGGVSSVRHFAALPDRLLVCTSDLFGVPHDLRVYDATAPGALIELGARSVPGGCRALAAAGDRRSAYLSTGADTLVVSPDGDVERSIGIASQSVHVGTGHVTLATTARAILLREADLDEVASVAGRVLAARHTSRGLEVVADEDAGGRVERSISFYEVRPGAPDPLSLSSREIVERDVVVPPSEASRWASHDDALLEGVRLFRMRASAPFLEEIRDPRRFWPYWLRAAGTTLHLRDDRGAIAIDVSDPSAPRAIAGGELHAAPGISIEIPEDGEIGLYGARGWWPTLGRHRPRALSTLSLPRLDLVARSFDASEAPTDHATHRFADAPTHLGATHRHLYAVDHDPSSLRVRRWNAAQFFAASVPEPQIDSRIDAPAGDAIEQIARLHDDGATAFATAAGWGSAAIHWVELASDATAPIAPIVLDVEVHDLAVHGDRVIVLGWRADPSDPPGSATIDDVVLVSLERRGGALVELSRTGWSIPPTFRVSSVAPIQLLRFDGHVAYAQLPFGTPAEPGPALVALRADDLSRSRTYPLPDASPIWSASDSDVGLVLSGPGGILVARPWCP